MNLLDALIIYQWELQYNCGEGAEAFLQEHISPFLWPYIRSCFDHQGNPIHSFDTSPFRTDGKQENVPFVFESEHQT